MQDRALGADLEFSPDRLTFAQGFVDDRLA
jgi:hypothetical protein